MAYKAVVGKVGYMYANNFNGFIYIVGKQWFSCPLNVATSFLTIAADARRADVPVFIGYDDSTGTALEIQSI
jgi:hypothetical protein